MQRVEPSKVLEFLESLGSTSEEIADTLAFNGVTGFPTHARSCALAVALERKFATFFSVGISNVKQVRAEGGVEGPAIPLSAILQEFTLKFDMRKYPELIEQER